MNANSSESQLRIRFSRPEEDALVGDLLVDAFLTHYAQKMPEVRYDDARKADLRDTAGKRKVAKVWVAELLGGEVVGTVSLWPPGAPGSEAWLPGAADLRHLGVKVGRSGKGISRALLDEAEAEAWRLGARTICLHVRRGALGVAQLYQTRGFRRDPSGDLDLPTVFLEAYFLPRPD